MTTTFIPSGSGSARISDEIQTSTQLKDGGILRKHNYVRPPSAEGMTTWTERQNDKSSRFSEPTIVKPLVRLPPGSLPKVHVEILQQWEGVVTGLTGDSFFADLQDLTPGSGAMEVAEILLAEISKEDRSLVKEGAVFYWSIGYETSSVGQLRRVSEIRFRRNPNWTQGEILKLKKKGEKLFEHFAG